MSECCCATEPGRCFWHFGFSPVSDPSETLALIAEHRLAYWPWGNGWVATNAYEMHSPREGEVSFRYDHCGEGPTIDDAVRACVARAKGEQRE